MIPLTRRKTSKRAKGRGPSLRNFGLIGAGLVLALGLIVWIPGLTAGGQLPQEGKPIANFVTTDSDGKPFELAEAYRHHYVILVFYRGHT